MKNITKLLAALLAATMCLFALASCSNNANTLKIATNAEFEPFESLDENGNYVGFDIDLINAIAAAEGKTVKIENMEFDAVLAAVTSGNCNVGLSGLTINDTRKKAVDFTDPYYTVGQVLIVKADDTAFTGTTKEELDEQLKNKTVGACSGYTGQFYIEGDAEWGFTAIEGLKSEVYDNPATAILDLKSGKIDAFILDDAVALKLAASDANKADVKVINVPLTVEEYAMAVQKGNTELLETLNNGLATLKENGELDNLLSKWGLN